MVSAFIAAKISLTVYTNSDEQFCKKQLAKRFQHKCPPPPPHRLRFIPYLIGTDGLLY